MQSKKNILLIGVGGTGSQAADRFQKKLKRYGNQEGNLITTLVLDSDQEDMAKLDKSTVCIPLSDNGSIGDICDRIGHDKLDWFDCEDEAIRAQEMYKGCSQWRKKSFLAFVNMMQDDTRRGKLHGALEQMKKAAAGQNMVYEIYVVASLAGGTGSGSFIPLTMYVKRYMREVLGVSADEVTALLACPEIYEGCQEGEEQRLKLFANAYGILREINAFNLVTRGYNKPEEKNTPISFRLGSPNEKFVEVLFDAEDDTYWKSEYAPFKRIYMMGRVPCLDVAGHNLMMADTLYTLLCTASAGAIDSAVSNMAGALAEEGKGNSIFSSLASADVVYPTDAILDYFATCKTEEAFEGDWRVLHNAVESFIREEEERAREARRPVAPMTGAKYAGLMMTAIDNERRNPTSDVIDILRRGYYKQVENADGRPEDVSRMDDYYAHLSSLLEAEIPDPAAMGITASIEGGTVVEKLGMFAGKEAKNDAKNAVVSAADDYRKTLLNYFNACLEALRTRMGSLVKNILPVEMDGNVHASEKFSLVEHLLMKDGKFIHPVSAMAILCEFKSRIDTILASYTPWKEINDTDVYTLPTKFLIASQAQAGTDVRHSAYATLTNAQKQNRFVILCDEKSKEMYLSSKTDATADSILLRNDALTSLNKLYSAAKDQMLGAVLSKVSARVEKLIEEYRSFFNKFDEAKRTLAEQKRKALNKDSVSNESRTFVGSSPEDKKRAYEDYCSMGSMTLEDIMQADSAMGNGIFNSTFAAVKNSFATRPVPMSSNIFGELIASVAALYRAQIEKKNNVLGKNPIQVLIEQTGDKGAAAAEALLSAYNGATPAFGSAKGDVAGNTFSGIMVSRKTAEYLYDHAEELGLKLSTDADRTSVPTLVSCVNQFINNNGLPIKRILINENADDTVISLTKALLTINPLDISKITGEYAEKYDKVLHLMDVTGTDTKNPHLGFGWHKPGGLAKLDVADEKSYDVSVAKALLFALMNNRLQYRKEVRDSFAVFRYNDEKIINSGEEVGEKNMHGLFAWLRAHEALVKEWAREFDADVKEQQAALAHYTAGDTTSVTRSITVAPYIQMLRENLFGGKKGSKDAPFTCGLIPFAFRIRQCEEAREDTDRNNAECILKVGYDTLVSFCRARTGSSDDAFLNIYKQQIDKFLAEALPKDPEVQKNSDPQYFYQVLVSWVNGADCFREISINYKETTEKKTVYDYSSYDPNNAKWEVAPKAEPKAPVENDASEGSSDEA